MLVALSGLCISAFGRPSSIGVEQTLSSQLFDHQEVVLQFRAQTMEPRKSTHRQVTYSILTSHPGRVLADLLKDMNGIAVGKEASTLIGISLWLRVSGVFDVLSIEISRYVLGCSICLCNVRTGI